jgi:hypothetical protein
VAFQFEDKSHTAELKNCHGYTDEIIFSREPEANRKDDLSAVIKKALRRRPASWRDWVIK